MLHPTVRITDALRAAATELDELDYEVIEACDDPLTLTRNLAAAISDLRGVLSDLPRLLNVDDGPAPSAADDLASRLRDGLEVTFKALNELEARF
ncbi:hypothetical protein ABZ208_13795 [Streptomyces sp. NPDC006208]|uniref:hypothetical protein n=1 Tax=Streptomyces sp. NPDC006208 TaxID=3156734 RepID=UPI0033B0D743